MSEGRKMMESRVDSEAKDEKCLFVRDEGKEVEQAAEWMEWRN